MNKKAHESLDKIKYLMEFHFKQHRNDSVMQIPDEQPVKFNEIGEVYKNEPEEHDFPTYDAYIDNVILDEDDLEDNNQPQNGQQPPMPDGGTNPVPQQPQNAQPAPAPAAPDTAPPVDTMPMAPEPAPTPAPVPEQPAAPDVSDDHIYSALEASIQKTDDMLAKFDMLQQQLAGMETVSMKLSDVEKKLEDLKNPPYDKQLEMISKKAYPYNIKLSDFWGWDKEEDDTEPEIENFKLTADDIGNYNKDDIKKSFTA